MNLTAQNPELRDTLAVMSRSELRNLQDAIGELLNEPPRAVSPAKWRPRPDADHPQAIKNN